MDQRHFSVAARLMKLAAVGSLAAVLALVAGCGQKGPLTLDPPPASRAASVPG